MINKEERPEAVIRHRDRSGEWMIHPAYLKDSCSLCYPKAGSEKP